MAKAKMTARDWKLFRIAILGAIVTRTIKPIAPIHELGHLLAAWASGIEASLGGWDYIWIAYSTPFVDAAGYFFEMIVLGLASYLFARRGKVRAVAFILGMASMTVVKWGPSMDVHSLHQSGADGIAYAGGPILFVIFLIIWSISYRALALRNPKP